MDAAVASLPVRPLAARQTAPTAIAIAPPAMARRVIGVCGWRPVPPEALDPIGVIVHTPLSFASHRSKASTWLPGSNTPDWGAWIASGRNCPVHGDGADRARGSRSPYD